MYPLPLRPALETQAEYTAEWLEIVDQVGPERFSEGLVSAVRGSEYFPTIKKLRDACGLSEENRAKHEAHAAWQYIQSYLDKGYGCDWCTNRPSLPERIDYAVRAVGGIQAMNNVKLSSLSFQRKDFCEAYERYQDSSVALGELLLAAPLELPQPKLLKSAEAAVKTEQVNVREALQSLCKPMRPAIREMTDVEWKDRKEILRQQAEMIKKREATS